MVFCSGPFPHSSWAILSTMLQLTWSFYFLPLLIYFWLCWVFLAACVLFSSCREQGLLSGCDVQASHCSGFSCCWAWALGPKGFSSCSSRALGYRLNSYGVAVLLLCGMWDLPGPGIELMSPTLAGRFFTTEAPEKFPRVFFFFLNTTIWQITLLKTVQWLPNISGIKPKLSAVLPTQSLPWVPNLVQGPSGITGLSLIYWTVTAHSLWWHAGS